MELENDGYDLLGNYEISFCGKGLLCHVLGEGIDRRMMKTGTGEFSF